MAAPYAGDVLKLGRAGAKAACAVSCSAVTVGMKQADRLRSWAYQAAAGAAVGSTLGAGVSAGASLYQGNGWPQIGSDALAGAAWGAVEGGLGGFTRGYYSFARACFAAGTPILLDMEGNSRAIEDIEVGDSVLTRSEFDPAGPLELKRVEEKFVRSSAVMDLVVGGHSIKTTSEHPFYVPAQGKFLAAGELKAGDELVSHTGQLVRIESVLPLGEVATVYNFRVADHHTYFFGCNEWKFSVWAHNADYGSTSLNKAQKTEIAKEWIAAKNAGAADPHGYTNASYAQKMKIRAIAHELIEADPMLLKPGASLHGNFATDTPGVRYNLARLSDDQARQAAGFADYQMGSVKKIGETTLAHQLPDGTWVQRRYTQAELEQWGVAFQVVESGPQTQMRANQSAILRAYEQQHGHLPELNVNYR